MTKNSTDLTVMPWDWEEGGIAFCIINRCSHLLSAILGGGYNKYQKGGIHFYCDCEDTMAAGCIPPIELDPKNLRCINERK